MAAAEDSIDMIKTEHDADDLSEDNSIEIPCLKKEEPENCTDLPKVEPDSYSEAYVSSSHDGSEVINIKVEVSDTEEDDDPMPATFSGIKAEQEKYTRRHSATPSVVRLYSRDASSEGFPGQCDLKKHQRRHSSERPHLCDTCDKSFCRLSSLNQHLRRHPGGRFCCDVCNKSFHAQGDLNIHQRIHSGERPYSCVVCSKSFSVRCNLITHQRIHSGERPYVCDVCKKSFRHLSNLKEHKVLHTRKRPYP